MIDRLEEPSETIENLRVTRKNIQDAIAIGKIINCNSGIYTQEIEPKGLIQWALDMRYDIPPPLKSLLQEEDEFAVNGKIPPYLNIEHPHYSTELDTSIRVWMKLFQSGGEIKIQPVTVISQIKNALQEEGITGIRDSGRLASGINPNWNKRGGNTKNKKPKTKKNTPVEK